MDEVPFAFTLALVQSASIGNGPFPHRILENYAAESRSLVSKDR